MKTWRTNDERLLPDCIQQMNTRNGGKVGISGAGTITAQISEGIMNGTLYCDILQQELTQSMIYAHVPTRSGALAYVKTRLRKNGKIEAERIRMTREESGS